LTNGTFLDKEVTNNGYLKKANPVVRSFFLSGTMKNSVIKSIWIILPIVLLLLFSCASTQQKQSESRDAKFYNNRGIAYGEKGQYDQAILDLNKAIEINPRYDKAYNNRGIVYRLKGQYGQAISDFNKAVEINPKDAEGYNNLAWLFATTKAPGFRNGKKAVELALKACELSDWRNAGYLDTLAAAYARVGDFDNAVKWQQKALESPQLAGTSDFQQRLNFYRERKPWPPD
jgi:tetratricopeptide (TPR) repeat protein